MHGDSHRHQARDYKSNPTNEINKVKTVMDACIANGIYGIIDWHSMGGAQNNVASSQDSSRRGDGLRKDPQHHVRTVERAGAGGMAGHQGLS